MASTFGLVTEEDWYTKVKLQDWNQNGGKYVLAEYDNKPSKALMSVYPDKNWVSWKLDKHKKVSSTTHFSLTNRKGNLDRC